MKRDIAREPYPLILADLGAAGAMSIHRIVNAPMESFFKTLKVERVDRVRYDSRAQAQVDIVSWIEGWYNQRRLHSTIAYKTPAELDGELMAA